MDIYARDGGICQFCLEPVDFDALYGPEVMSIDHIDREGPHTRANCRLTHQFCNNDAQWASGFDPELAWARLHYKVATNEKAGPGDHFPRRSPITGHVVSTRNGDNRNPPPPTRRGPSTLPHHRAPRPSGSPPPSDRSSGAGNSGDTTR
ncbi:HNH endonuclease [Rhodococcus sp. NM-2]|uniref:HNH endonuclease n=1 Tax=Rhodococcus sp. NM-2 TaxID=3401174 RepID=UPI003AAAA342